MARLNDVVPPPVESIEAVKRRYLRQNRELARCNSMQSQRIRMLEGEVSRLLTMNAEVSQENIALRVELDNRPSIDGVQSVRQKLEQQMKLLGSLVADLATMQQQQEPAEQIRTATAVRPERSELDRMEDEARHMPVIREEQPWASPSQRERRRSSTDARVTFDLSPSVAQPVHEPMHQGTASPIQQRVVASPVKEHISDALSMNLETRRKRRDSDRRSTLIVDVSDTTASTEPKDEATDRSRSKLGLKRKLDVRDDSADVRSTSPVAQQGTHDRNLVRKFGPPILKNATRDKRELQQPVRMASTQQRRPFGEKPVNTDPVVSPKKAKKSSMLDKSTKPPPIAIVKERLVAQREEEPRNDAVRIDNVIDVDHDMRNIAPKTPASDDLFSPQSYASTDRPIAKDTPPPTNVAFGAISSGAEPVGRAGRRARAVVNYAEPSLISKMRRPTKELVDAVGRDGRPIPGAIIRKASDKPIDQWQPKTSASAFSDMSMSRDEATSPLIARPHPSADADQEMLDADLLSRQSGKRPPPSGDFREKSRVVASGGASIDLDRRRRTIDEIKEAELAVYDFKDSSPLSHSSEEAQPRKAVSHRRHSSMVDVQAKLETAKADDARKTEVQDVLARSSRSIARRRSMMV